MDEKKLVVCAVFENQADWLPEFLAYHRVIGVDHFVLYDNGSTDDPARAIRHLPLAEHVTLVPWPRRPGRASAYRHFIDIFSPAYAWAAFIDVDEFLLPMRSGNVGDTLDWLGSAAAVLVHRRVFGPATRQDQPRGLAIERHDRRAADDFPGNHRTKAIIRCSALLGVGDDAQEFRIDGPVFNTAGDLATNSAVQAPPCYQNLVINHYAARSREDWLANARRNGDAMPQDDPATFDRLAAICQVQDLRIQAFTGPVRDLLGLGSAGAAPPAAIGPIAATAAMADPATTAVTPPPDPRPETAPALAPVPEDVAPAWVARGADAQERNGGLGMVFRDRSRPGEHWFAAVRSAAVAAIDPMFLLDAFDRIRDFPSAAAARAACAQALSQHASPAGAGEVKAP